MNPEECPECGSMNTKRVHTEHYTDEVEVTRVCKECPTQYDVSYGEPYKRGVMSLE